jgi:hypothetical protein
VPGTTDLEKDETLILELNFFVVDPAGKDHRPIGSEEVVASETDVIRSREWFDRVVLRARGPAV